MMIDQALGNQTVFAHAFVGGSFDKAIAEGEVAEGNGCEGFQHNERFSDEGKNDFLNLILLLNTIDTLEHIGNTIGLLCLPFRTA
jgi:hypothetical protein